jgi:hypothetical protein
MIHRELDLLHRLPFNTWRLCRIHSYDPPSPQEVALKLEDDLSYTLRFHSFTAQVKAEDNKIYIKKVRNKSGSY